MLSYCATTIGSGLSVRGLCPPGVHYDFRLHSEAPYRALGSSDGTKQGEEGNSQGCPGRVAMSSAGKVCSSLPPDSASKGQEFKENSLKRRREHMKDTWRQKSGTLVRQKGRQADQAGPWVLGTVGIRQGAGRARPQKTFQVRRNKQKTSGLGNRCKLFLSRNSQEKKKSVLREGFSEAWFADRVPGIKPEGKATGHGAGNLGFGIRKT